MLKLMYFALFISLTTLLACSGTETSPSPTAAPVEIPVEDPVPAEDPAQAESPIPTGDPTTAPVEEPTPTDEPLETTPEPGMLAPINLNDPEAFMSQLSNAEQSCISENGDPRQLLMLMGGPGPGPSPGSPQDAQELIPCLGEETLLRLFLTGLTGQTEPLSAETSTCVRSGFQDFDIATVLLSSSMGHGGEEAAMMGSMAGFVLTLSCLNEEEWQIASPRLGLIPEERESLQCVTSQLGGPAGLATALQPRDGEPPTAYTKAATACGLQMAGGLQMPSPSGPGMPDPSGMNDTGLLVSDLSDAELSCLSENGDPQQLLMLVNRPDLTSPEERNALAGCLEHETMLNIFLKGFTDQAGPMSSDTSACVSAGFQNLDLPAMMLTNPEEPDEETGVVQVMAGLIIVLACLNEEEWQAASQNLDLLPNEREALQCTMTKLGGPEGIVASLESKEGEQPTAFFNAATECGLTIMEEPSG